jgi:hypothetical protein
MLSLLTLSIASAASHSAATAETITQLGRQLDRPVLILLEGDFTSPSWLRLEGWIKVPIERVLLSTIGDVDAAALAAVEDSDLACAIHLRQTSAGWEGALVGECGDARLPEELAFTEREVSTSSLGGLSVEGLRGFRVGYAYSLDEALLSPHLLVMGFELGQRIAGGEGLDVLMTANLAFAGINQSILLPTLNLQLGFEVSDSLQLMAGPSIAWTKPEEEMLHMMASVGWIGEAGLLRVPLHLAWIPDVHGRDQFLATTGVMF